MNQQFSGAAAIRAAAMIMGSTYVTYAVGLLVSIVIARHLGPEDFGRYSYVIWMAGILIALGNNGLTTTVIRFVSESLGRRSVESARRVHGWLLRRQLVCFVLVSVVFVLASRHLAPDGWQGSLASFVVIALVAGVSKALYLFDASVAKGYGRFDVEARSTVTLSLVNVAAVLVLVYFDAPLMGYLVAFTLISVGYGAMSRWMLRRGDMVSSTQPLDADMQLRVRRHLLWTVILILAYTFSNKSIETYLLNAMVGPAEVGFFTIAAALSRGGVDLLSSGLMTVMMPIMAHAFGEGGLDRVNSIMANSLRYCFFLGLLLIGVGLLLSRPGVSLMYGEKYADVVFPLRVMILVGGLTLGEAALNALLSTTDNQRLRVIFSCLSLGVAATFAFVLVPRYGLAGAVMSYACSRLLMFVVLAVGITRLMRFRVPVRELVRLFGCALLAGTISAGMVLLVPGIWSELVAGIAFALLFVAGTIAFNAWRSSDVGHFLEFLERYPFFHGRMSGFLERWALRLR